MPNATNNAPPLASASHADQTRLSPQVNMTLGEPSINVSDLQDGSFPQATASVREIIERPSNPWARGRYETSPAALWLLFALSALFVVAYVTGKVRARAMRFRRRLIAMERLK
jgi:hypothetical protein